MIKAQSSTVAQKLFMNLKFWSYIFLQNFYYKTSSMSLPRFHQKQYKNEFLWIFFGKNNIFFEVFPVFLYHKRNFICIRCNHLRSPVTVTGDFVWASRSLLIVTTENIQIWLYQLRPEITTISIIIIKSFQSYYITRKWTKSSR